MAVDALKGLSRDERARARDLTRTRPDGQVIVLPDGRVFPRWSHEANARALAAALRKQVGVR